MQTARRGQLVSLLMVEEASVNHLHDRSIFSIASEIRDSRQSYTKCCKTCIGIRIPSELISRKHSMFLLVSLDGLPSEGWPQQQKSLLKSKLTKKKNKNFPPS